MKMLYLIFKKHRWTPHRSPHTRILTGRISSRIGRSVKQNKIQILPNKRGSITPPEALIQSPILISWIRICWISSFLFFSFVYKTSDQVARFRTIKCYSLNELQKVQEFGRFFISFGKFVVKQSRPSVHEKRKKKK